LGFSIGSVAVAHPLDQPRSASTDGMGSDGVSSGELSQASTMGMVETGSIDCVSDAGCCDRRSDVGAMGEWFSMAFDGEPVNYASLFHHRRFRIDG
jgi:hypothetical protein